MCFHDHGGNRGQKAWYQCSGQGPLAVSLHGEVGLEIGTSRRDQACEVASLYNNPLLIDLTQACKTQSNVHCETSVHPFTRWSPCDLLTSSRLYLSQLLPPPHCLPGTKLPALRSLEDKAHPKNSRVALRDNRVAPDFLQRSSLPLILSFCCRWREINIFSILNRNKFPNKLCTAGKGLLCAVGWIRLPHLWPSLSPDQALLPLQPPCHLLCGQPYFVPKFYGGDLSITKQDRELRNAE